MRNSQTETDTTKALTIHTHVTTKTHSTLELERSALDPTLALLRSNAQEKELSSPTFTALSSNSTRVH